MSTAIEVREITDPADLEQAFAIRGKVFVEEQKVPREEEYDEFEDSSRHYLGLINGTPAGAARWRITDKGVKLERFAVLPEFRSKAVGGEILKRVLKDVNTDAPGRKVYLHAQLPAIQFYERHGFKAVGGQFSECDIEHFKMELHTAE
jgi:predicted GNAT family N-acyltransferase